jgi:hypothetical protein
MWHPCMGLIKKCEYKDCIGLATHFTKGGLFGIVRHCHFHSIRCIADGYATHQQVIN